MRVGLFDPYLDTLGGGERYMMTLAACSLQAGHRVDVFWSGPKIKKGIKRRFQLDLRGAKFLSPPANLFQKWQKGRKYDFLVYLSDGSLPFLFAKKSVLHFQVPFHHLDGRRYLNRLKLKLIDAVVCNSFFTKKFIDQEYGVRSLVIHPPVDTARLKPLNKKNFILSVGRFDSPLHPKRQDVLIKAFKKMNLPSWKLVLAGGVQKENNQDLAKLRNLAQDLPIEFLINVDFQTLRRLYGQAKIYWHGAGFEIDEEKEPEKVEHFGMTTVEAMASGCVPVVCGQGGQREIVEPGEDGFWWQTEKELIKYTNELISDDKKRLNMAAKAVKKSQKFSQKRFCQKWLKLIH